MTDQEFRHMIRKFTQTIRTENVIKLIEKSKEKHKLEWFKEKLEKSRNFERNMKEVATIANTSVKELK